MNTLAKLFQKTFYSASGGGERACKVSIPFHFPTIFLFCLRLPFPSFHGSSPFMRRGKWKKVKDSLFPGPSLPVSPSSSIISFLNLKVNSSRLEQEAIDRIRISRNSISVCRNIRLTGMEMETWRDNDSLLKRNLETCCPVFRSWRDCTVSNLPKNVVEMGTGRNFPNSQSGRNDRILYLSIFPPNISND